MEEAHKTMSASREEHEAAVAEIEAATDSFAKAEQKNMTVTIEYARKRLSVAKELEATLKKTYENDVMIYNNAKMIWEEAKESLTEVKTELDSIRKELQGANSYLEELYKKNEVIDVDADTPISVEPAHKKQRLTTNDN